MPRQRRAPTHIRDALACVTPIHVPTLARKPTRSWICARAPRPRVNTRSTSRTDGTVPQSPGSPRVTCVCTSWIQYSALRQAIGSADTEPHALQCNAIKQCSTRAGRIFGGMEERAR
uniref:Uncharacterized protein n=1 Tax=Chrysotila carterae TaxID=13221 RepID=A0A7S4EVB0_CHRCT|eukprot:755785-Pleurochrysis_carterae.AAC.1